MRLTDEFQHINMIYSDLAAPLDASIFLMNSKGPGCLKAGSRYVSLDELMIEDSEPDARSRFVYNDSAHRSAKIIAKLFVANLEKRRAAVRTIEKYYSFHLARKRYRVLFQKRVTASMVLQFAFRRKLGYVKRFKAR